MHLLLLCNLVPSKRGAFEEFVRALAGRLRDEGDKVTAIFGGQPSPDVGSMFAEAGLIWHVAQGWTTEPDVPHPWKIVSPRLRHCS